MSVVTIDKKLSRVDLENPSREHSYIAKNLKNQMNLDAFIKEQTDIKTDYKTRTISQSLFHYANDLEKESFYHRNYLEYLSIAWSGHYGVKITPDILWYTLLTEIASIVKADPETYRHLFTDSPDKKDIIIVCEDPTIIPIHLLMGHLQDLVPTDTDIFCPSFTTTTDRAKTAQRAAFADAVSPYYNYMTLMCGIPYVEILGEEKDWIQIGECWTKIASLFKTEKEYFKKVSKIITEIIKNFKNPTSDFWKGMFEIKLCGSGHQEELFGWITDLFKIQPKHTRYASNFSTGISTVNYRDLTHQKDFQMKQGLFYSKLEGDFINPDFGYLVYEKREVESVPYKPVMVIESQTIGGFGGTGEITRSEPFEIELGKTIGEEIISEIDKEIAEEIAKRRIK